MIGKTLAHYEITALLGKGGMGEVYRARDTKLQRDVALKVLPADVAADPERVERFRREATAVAALNHPNIVTIHSVEEADGVVFLTMEVVEGGSLARVIPEGGQDLATFFGLAQQIVDGIGAAHAAGITHRDLKPENVRIAPDHRVKILDFGLAKLTDAAQGDDDRTIAMQRSGTAEGRILGTVDYMSPEQAQGNPVDHRSDIFSLGILFYRMLTGKLPFDGANSISTISAILKDTPTPVIDLRADLPMHLSRIIARCLKKDPAERYASVRDIAIELRDLSAEVESGIHEAPTSVEMDRPRIADARSSKRTMQRVMLAVAALVVVAGGVYVVTRSGAGEPASSTPGTTASATELVAAEAARDMLVVLPFEHLGPDAQSYVTAGITAEISTRLARVRDLGVISRTTAVQYDRAGKTMGQIGVDLGVTHVVEGVAQWAEDADGSTRVRMTATLVRVEDDVAVWSQTFEQPVDDVFALQSDIATTVAQALDLGLASRELTALNERPTANDAAYDAYLRAQVFEAQNPMETWTERRRLYERAVELDPEFLEAWSELCQWRIAGYQVGVDVSDEVLRAALDAVRRAEALDPDHPATLTARGSYHYVALREYDVALDYFERALAQRPNDDRILSLAGYIHRREGDLDRAVDFLWRAHRINPRADEYLRNLAATARGRRDFDEAFRIHDIALENAVDPDVVRERIVGHMADAGFARASIEAVAARIESSFYRAYSEVDILFANGEYEEASVVMQEVMGGVPMNPTVEARYAHAVAVARVYAVGSEAAREELERAEEAIAAVLAGAPGDELLLSLKAHVLAHLGRRDEALSASNLAIRVSSRDRWSGPKYSEYLAAVHAVLGEFDDAFEILERMVVMDYEDAITRHQLETAAEWAPLRKDPRFSSLLERFGT